MNTNYTFLIDVDEVLRQTLSKMVEVYNKHFPDTKVKFDEVSDYVTEKSFPGIKEVTGMTASHWFFQEHGKEMFLESNPFPFIKEDIETLKKYGKVVILTYQKTYDNKFDTLEWLKMNGIEADGICFLKDKTLMSGTYMIDDNDWNFQGCNSTYGILISAPYNKDVDTNKLMLSSGCSKIERSDSLNEFVKKFVAAMETIEKFEKKYPEGKEMTIKSPVPYDEKNHCFGKVGDTIVVNNYYLHCLEPKVHIKLKLGWGSVLVKLNDFENCLA